MKIGSACSLTPLEECRKPSAVGNLLHIVTPQRMVHNCDECKCFMAATHPNDERALDVTLGVRSTRLFLDKPMDETAVVAKKSVPCVVVPLVAHPGD